jgi:transposase
VIETVSDTHNSGDFIAFLRKLDSAYPEHHQIRLVLDNHSAHISKETRGYLQTIPQRFVFVFTPTHGSWLNLIENQFSKMTRTMLRGIRVNSKQELIDRRWVFTSLRYTSPVKRCGAGALARGRPPGRPSSMRTWASAAVQGDRPTRRLRGQVP